LGIDEKHLRKSHKRGVIPSMAKKAKKVAKKKKKR